MKPVSAIIYLSLKSYTYFTKTARLGRLRRKVQKLIKVSQVKKLESEQKKDIVRYYAGFGIKKINTDWHRFYAGCNRQFYNSYVPEDLFYTIIEPKLNKITFCKALEDKNLLGTLFPNIRQPEFVIKNINGFYFNHNTLITEKEACEKCNNQTFIIKPTVDTGGGKNVALVTVSETKTDFKDYSIEDLFKSYDKDFIVQKIVDQHPCMKQLNQTSLNTLRVMSFLEDTQVKILSTIVRFGRKGAITDNGTSGGISCGVNSDGKLNSTGFEPLTGKAFNTTDEGLSLGEVSLPFMDKVEKLIIELHKKVPHFRLISWDFAIDNLGEIVLVEYNVAGQGINLHQLNNGAVLTELLNEI